MGTIATAKHRTMAQSKWRFFSASDLAKSDDSAIKNAGIAHNCWMVSDRNPPCVPPPSNSDAIVVNAHRLTSSRGRLSHAREMTSGTRVVPIQPCLSESGKAMGPELL